MTKRPLNEPLGVIILAAGKGTRMDSDLAKVLHPVAGRPMLAYVIDAARQLEAQRIVVVVGYEGKEVRRAFSNFPDLIWVEQKNQLGTGDAVKVAAGAFAKFQGEILILYGDIPGVRIETLRRLAMVHASSDNAITLLTAALEDPTGYGRIVVNGDGSVAKIVEERDADDEVKTIQEVNTGIGLYDSRFLFSEIEKLKPQNKQKEYYLTDLVEAARQKGRSVGRLHVADVTETLGINDREDLAEVTALFYDQKARIGSGTRIGNQTVIGSEE